MSKYYGNNWRQCMSKKKSSPLNFFDKYSALREARLPIKSNIYEVLSRYYACVRREDQTKWRSKLHVKLPKSTISYYNCQFSDVERMLLPLIEKSSIPEISKSKAIAKAQFRLASNSCLEDLLRTDIFGQITTNQDIPVEEALTGISKSLIADYSFRLNTYHFILHGFQNTECLFLHELIVGYLGNIMQNSGKIPSRERLPPSPSVYWTMPAYACSLLASVLRRTPDEIAALHFVDDKVLRDSLPSNILDLMLFSALIYCYLDYYVKSTNSAMNPTLILEILVFYFLNPSLEKIERYPRTKLRKDAGKFTDDCLIDFLHTVTSKNPTSLSHYDLAILTNRLVDQLWVAPRLNKSKFL